MLCRRLALAVLVASMAASIATVTVNGQTRSGSGATVPKGWTPPRAADGHPSLEGVWENNSAIASEDQSDVWGLGGVLQRSLPKFFGGLV